MVKATQHVQHSLPLQINVPTAEDSQLHQYATQALMAAAAYADSASSPTMLNAAAITPQPARTGTADASSSHQPERHHSHAEQHDIEYDKTSALPASQAKTLSPNVSSRLNMLLSQAAAPVQSGLKQTAHNLQTPGFCPKSKKHHPLYTPASAPGKTTQQKKGKPKAGGGFAIRQPVATVGPASTKVLSTKDALHQLVGPPPPSNSALNQGHPSAHQNKAGHQDRPGSIAKLLGITEPINPDEGIEEVEVEVQDVQHLQPPDSGQQLLDTMLEGRLSPARARPLSQAPQHAHAPSPWTPAAKALDVVESRPSVAVTPAMTLQRQFIASLQDTPAVSTSRHTSGRSQAMPGTLSARLSRIVQLEKAQQTQFQATGSLGSHTMDVTVTEHRLEGHIVKCRCHKLHEADQVFVMFSSKLCNNVNLTPGCCVTLHAPWTDLHPAGCSIPVILCQYVSARIPL